MSNNQNNDNVPHQQYMHLLNHCNQLEMILQQKDEYTHNVVQNKTN